MVACEIDRALAFLHDERSSWGCSESQQSITHLYPTNIYPNKTPARPAAKAVGKAIEFAADQKHNMGKGRNHALRRGMPVLPLLHPQGGSALTTVRMHLSAGHCQLSLAAIHPPEHLPSMICYEPIGVREASFS